MTMDRPKQPETKPGHLKDGDLNLQVTAQRKVSVKRARRADMSVQKMAPVKLDWTRK